MTAETLTETIFALARAEANLLGSTDNLQTTLARRELEKELNKLLADA